MTSLQFHLYHVVTNPHHDSPPCITESAPVSPTPAETADAHERIPEGGVPSEGQSTLQTPMTPGLSSSLPEKETGNWTEVKRRHKAPTPKEKVTIELINWFVCLLLSIYLFIYLFICYWLIIIIIIFVILFFYLQINKFVNKC